jgi:hypothetical protein
MMLFIFIRTQFIWCTSCSLPCVNLWNLLVNQVEFNEFFNLTIGKFNWFILWKIVFKFNCIKGALLVLNKGLSSDIAFNDSVTSINSLNKNFNMVLFP